MKYIHSFCAALVAATSWAQPAFLRTYDLVPDAIITGSDLTPDGGLIIAATDATDSWLLKLDAAGNVQWSRGYAATIGYFSDPNTIRITDVAAAADGGYVVVGYHLSAVIQDQWDAMSAKLDAAGNKIWAHSSGSGAWPDYLSATSIKDSLLYYAGRYGGALGGSAYVCAIGLNNGAFLTGSGLSLMDHFPQPSDVRHGPDGSVVLAGNEFLAVYDASLGLQWQQDQAYDNGEIHPDGSVTGSDGTHLVHFQPGGQLAWGLTSNLPISDLRARPNGDLVITGAIDGYIWLAELDPEGTLMWVHRYGESGGGQTAGDLYLLDDGSIRVVGRYGVELLVLAVDGSGTLTACPHPDPALTLSPYAPVAGTPLFSSSSGPGASDENYQLPSIGGAYWNTTIDCLAGSMELQGSLFMDQNGNGAFDPGEPCFPYQMVSVEPEGASSLAGSDCLYHHVTTVPGSHTIAPAITFPWWEPSGDSTSCTVLFTGNDTIVQGLDFGFVPAYDTAVIVSSFASGPTGCSMDHVDQVITLLNQGTVAGDAMVSLALDPLTPFISSVPAPDSIVANVVYWHVNDVAPAFLTAAIHLVVELPSYDFLDDTLHATLVTCPLDENGDPANSDTLSWSDVFTCSYDPNDKLVTPAGNIGPGQEWLTYTVRFQNTGTDTAHVVVIQDQLSPNLDQASFQVIGCSHVLTAAELSSGGLVTFRFENILLPDSGTNEVASHGYIAFRLRPRPDVQHGDIIANDAAIFFDQNEPVITDLVHNTWVDCTSIDDTVSIALYGSEMSVIVNFSGHAFQWYLNGEPIPGATDTWMMNPEPGDYQVTVTDDLGCVVWSSVLTVLATGIANNAQGLIRVIPNPVDNLARVLLPWPLATDARVELLDVNGRLVRSMNAGGRREVLIERGHLESGIYVLRVMRGGASIGSGRIIID